MIQFQPLISPDKLIIEQLAVNSPKYCFVCSKDFGACDNKFCPHCGFPFEQFSVILEFYYLDYLQHSWINLNKVIAYFNQDFKPFLNSCAFCGGAALPLSYKTFSLLNRYFPTDSYPVQRGKLKDVLHVDALFLECSGCTRSTPYLYLYQFYTLYQLLMDAWDSGNSRLPLVKYVDLDLPDWSVNGCCLIKKYKKLAAEYEKQFSRQAVLF